MIFAEQFSSSFMHSFIETLAPETRLLVCCARVRVNPETASDIRALVLGDLDWDALLGCAARHAVAPLLDRQLLTVAADLIPANQISRMNEANRVNTLRCLQLTAALVEILRLFQAEGIAALPYKGPILAAQAYGDLSMRQFDDIDIVVPQREMAKAQEIVLGLGYTAKFPGVFSPGNSYPIPGEYKYYSETRDAIVELHTEFTLRHFPVTCNFDDFYARSVELNLGGHHVRTFSPEDALLAICVHGSKDFWERLSWIADVAELLESHSELDWSKIGQRAESLRVERMLRVGRALAARVLGTQLPDEMNGSVRKDRVAEAIAEKLAGKLLGGTEPPMGALERFHLRRRMVSGFFPGWRYALRLAFAPAEEDWTTVQLPRPLAPLYVLLRPFRLMRKYGGSREAV
jgi:hypothetical protein